MIDFLLGPLLKMIGFDYKNKRAKDKALIEEFLNLLPSDGGSINMLKDADMGNSLNYQYFGPLNDVTENWYAPDKKFQVRRLESLKLDFLDATQSFLSEYSKRSAMDTPGFISIGMRDFEDRPEMLEYRDRLNELATTAYKSYEKFVSIARSEI